jgi:NAD(P)-dependent dehydrogenase (short-subunit alcohol dehydrogenase family)
MKRDPPTVIITGGTGALGSVVATSFLESGARLAIPYHSERSLSDVPTQWTETADRVLLRRADVTLETDVRAFCDEVKKRLGRIDVLLNIVGGYAGGKKIAETSLDEWERMLELNLKSAFLMSREVVHEMMQNGFGRIVSISARQATLPGARSGPYAVAKRGVLTLTEILAEEVKNSGVTVNAIAPSTIVTEANTRSMGEKDISRWVSPEEIAGLVMYLCSDAARSINGTVVRMFGGL